MTNSKLFHLGVMSKYVSDEAMNNVISSFQRARLFNP